MRQYETQIRVRYEDADPMGFLHHAQYFYFEVARLELFRVSGGDYRAMEDAGLFVVVVKAECRYRKPARFDDVLTVRVSVDRLTAAKIEHSYEILRDADSLASGLITLAMVDKNGQVQPIPDWVRDVY